MENEEFENVDVFRLQDTHKRESVSDSPEKSASSPLNQNQGEGQQQGQGHNNKPLPEDEGKDLEVIDQEIDQRRIAMRDAFRKLLGQKLGSIYVTNHQERKAKPKLPYYVRVNHNVIDYREAIMGRKERYTYNFNTGECKYEMKPIKQYAIKRFFKKLDQVSEDITNKISLVYEEPKRAGQ